MTPPPPAKPSSAPSTIHMGRPSISSTWGTRSAYLAGARLVPRSGPWVRWVSASTTRSPSSASVIVPPQLLVTDPHPTTSSYERVPDKMGRSAGAGKAQVDLARRRVGPAGGHDLGPGVEADALGAVHGTVAEQGRLSPAEREEPDGDRDGDVDADHARRDVALEAPGGAAIPGEQGRAVAVRGGIDEVDRLLKGVDAHDTEDGPEDLVVVRPHAGSHAVEQGTAEEEALGPVPPAVHHQARPFSLGPVDVGAHAVSVLGRDARPHLRFRVVAGADN